MRVDRLRLVDYRNYREKEIRPAGVTLIVGENASGKTNLVEAIRVATSTTSFRATAWSELVRWGSGGARVEVDATGDSSHIEIVLSVDGEGRRTYQVNGSTKRRLADVVGLVPTVAFTPDDLQFVKGPPEGRRASTDQIGSGLWAVYGDITADYAKALRHRNRALKDGRPGAQLEPWSAQIAVLGGRLAALRTRLVSRMRPVFAEAYRSISDGEEADVTYTDKSGFPDEAWVGGIDEERARDAIATRLTERAEDEARRGRTLAGPHRDDLAFTIAGRDARTYGSQGQQRSIALAWKVAELRTLEEVTKRRPILLLDDVMSELDACRRRALTGLVGDATQTLITTTNLGYFDDETLSGAEVIEIP